ncbi:sugar phosphate isomerase/epimerase [Termitidicoccus mucosus]|uniref:Xylose isomerase n=1 Tax=Termitidicoccus mucosus TaxID=1184151 RepID=A0A178IBW5_9BACT|nr:xylose isomerase [Opitutaceae bacterium TSB47]
MHRLCIHTITTKPWSIAEAVRNYAAAGVRHITVWRDAIAPHTPAEAGKLIRDHGLSVTSLCRGGFFPALAAAVRVKAIDENRRCIDEAAALGAPHVVLVCGATPGQSLAESRKQITDGIAALLPHAAAAGVKLAIEPLHPMYAGDRSAVNTMAQARTLCRSLASPHVGIAADTYHIWWDDDLENQLTLAARENLLLAYHVCDWRVPTTDFLNDRGLMGEGAIPLRAITAWVNRTGYTGPIEVEIFSTRLWAADQHVFLKNIITAYRDHVI